MNAAPEPAPTASLVHRTTGVLEAAVGDGLLLVDPVLVRAHGLNPTAAVIWAELGDDEADRALGTDEVVERVAATFSLDPDVVRDGVLDTIDRFAQEGLLHLDPSTGEVGPKRDPDEIPGHFANVPHTDEPVPEALGAPRRTSHLGPFRGLDVTFDLVTDDDEIARFLAEVWAPLAVAADPTAATAATAVRHYAIVGSGPDPSTDLLLALDGYVVARAGAASAIVGQAVWHANQLVSTETDRYLQLHAGAVVIDDGAVLLPAAMNSGKSTLTTALVADGAGYLTDETVALDPDTGLVHPYPKSISLDPGSWTLFGDLEPRAHRALPGLAHHKWYVDPDTIRAGAAAGPARPAAIVFPTYDPSRPTRRVPMAPVDAAAELARNSFNLPRMGQVGVDVIAALASTVPCSSLSVHDVASGVAAVRDARRGAGSPTSG